MVTPRFGRVPAEIKKVRRSDLEQFSRRARDLGRGWGRAPAWLREHVDGDAQSILRVLLEERSEPRCLRCTVRAPLRAGGYVHYLIDVASADFKDLPTLTSGELDALVHDLLSDLPFDAFPPQTNPSWLHYQRTGEVLPKEADDEFFR